MIYFLQRLETYISDHLFLPDEEYISNNVITKEIFQIKELICVNHQERYKKFPILPQ